MMLPTSILLQVLNLMLSFCKWAFQLGNMEIKFLWKEKGNQIQYSSWYMLGSCLSYGRIYSLDPRRLNLTSFIYKYLSHELSVLAARNSISPSHSAALCFLLFVY